MYDLKTWFLLFMIYSFIGWIIEVIDIFIVTKKVINRGFLIGPYCPIYGYGSLFIIYFLHSYTEDPIVLFVMTVVICSILEYTTSYLMEKIFKARWWDYSNNRFNINGRICLETMIPFGIGGCLILYIANPMIMNILSFIPSIVQTIVASILFIIFLIDNLVSFKVILNFKKVASTVRKDSTEEISKKVRAVLSSKSILSKRLMNAFPNVQAMIKNYNRKRKEKHHN